jgi:hypothetical protein
MKPEAKAEYYEDHPPPHPAEYQGNRQRSILAAICSPALKQVGEWLDLHPSELQRDWSSL